MSRYMHVKVNKNTIDNQKKVWKLKTLKYCTIMITNFNK